MRIISQNGAVNFPYEMTAVLVDGNVVKALLPAGSNIPYVMATYENEEKCQKAMGRLDVVYGMLNSKNNITFRFPKDDEL